MLYEHHRMIICLLLAVPLLLFCILRLRGMEEEFYKYADVEDLASELNITTELATTFHRFWTLKRKVATVADFNLIF